jgi:hypothetical protein
MKYPIAFLLSDLHLRITTPSSRAESDWRTILWEAFNGIKQLRDTIPGSHNIPLFVAGDIFDQWNPPADLVTFTIKAFQSLDMQVFVIPGQHDLHGHDYERRTGGAYGALLAAGVVTDIPAEQWCTVDVERRNSKGDVTRSDTINVWGCPWGRYGLPEEGPDADLRPSVNLMLLHKYAYNTNRQAYRGAPETGRVAPEQYRYFDAVLAGDNHIPWLKEYIIRSDDKEYLYFYNHGGFLPQNSDQKGLEPAIGILYNDGSVEITIIPGIPDPIWTEVNEIEYNPVASDFIQSLNDLEQSRPDFLTQLRLAAEHETRAGIQAAIRKIIDGCAEPS